MGGEDPWIPAEEIKSFEDALNAAGVENEIVTYQGAPHSFFDREWDAHKDACDDAWRRVLAFIDRNSK
jgi:carboxymethylenebutenolidase